MRHIFILFWLLCGLAGIDAQVPITIIVNSDNDMESLETASIRNIYLGKKTKWDNGEKIVPVCLKEGELCNDFLHEYVKKTIDGYDGYWRQRIFTGKGVPPMAFETENEILQYVSRNSFAISYVSAQTEIDTFSVRTLTVIN